MPEHNLNPARCLGLAQASTGTEPNTDTAIASLLVKFGGVALTESNLEESLAVLEQEIKTISTLPGRLEKLSKHAVLASALSHWLINQAQAPANAKRLPEIIKASLQAQNASARLMALMTVLEKHHRPSSGPLLGSEIEP